ncbi:MAG: tRNA lysidine(34) synthetase TilS, partial [Rhodospirillaceae bacterium]|nr:tRNA lysidine(34) synthetase TilS [Rhodospirillaceae bacterium]
MVLCLLAKDWVETRQGRLTALIVDHALRPDSAREARQVAAWLRRRGLSAVVLRREGPRPAADVQAAARAARYRLLTQWCRNRGVLHLLLAHHREDQAETLLLRLARGSGLNGLAAMPAIAELDGVRLLRPLLGVPKARLKRTLEALGQPWIEDPSNQEPAYARVRLRRLSPMLAAEGLTAARLAATAERLGLARAALDRATAELLAGAAALRPEGYLVLGLEALAAAPVELSLLQ